jgi:hypothetical protein
VGGDVGDGGDPVVAIDDVDAGGRDEGTVEPPSRVVTGLGEAGVEEVAGERVEPVQRLQSSTSAGSSTVTSGSAGGTSCGCVSWSLR